MKKNGTRKIISMLLAVLLAVSTFSFGTLFAEEGNAAVSVNTAGTYPLFNSGRTGEGQNLSGTDESLNFNSASFDNGGYDIYMRVNCQNSIPGEAFRGCVNEAQIGRSFYIAKDVTELCRVSINAYDTDENDGELDFVYLVDETTSEKVEIGTLSGRDKEWNNTSFYIYPDYLEVGHTYHIEIKITSSVIGRVFWVYVRNASLSVSAVDGSETPGTPDLILDAGISAVISPAGVITASINISPSKKLPLLLEFKAAYSASGEQLGSRFANAEVPLSGLHEDYSFSLESGSPKGAYRVELYIKDATSGDILKTVSCTAGYAYSAVSYHANGGTNNVPEDTTSYSAGDTVYVIFDFIPSKMGFKFLGWARTQTATEPEFTAMGTQSFVIGGSDVTLYAVWDKTVLPPVTPPDTRDDVWDGTVGTGFDGGDGSEGSPYLIRTGEQLAFLAKTTNEGNNYKGKYFKLMNSIDLRWLEWTPIGLGTPDSSVVPALPTNRAFCGHFDGNHQVIRNLRILQSTSGFVGLFGVINGGSVKDLGVENADMHIKYGQSNFAMGSLAGGAYNSVIERCYATGNLYAEQASNYGVTAGILLGVSDGGVVRDCYTLGSAMTVHQFASPVNAAGGVIGSRYSTSNSNTVSNLFSISTVAAENTVTSNRYYGYTVGASFETVGIMENCFGCTTSSVGGTTLVSGEAILTPEAFKAAGSFTGFDFVKVWVLEAEKSHPTLQGFGNGPDLPPAHTHSFRRVSVPATCTEPGSVKNVCDCGHAELIDYMPPLGHIYRGDVTKAPTCTESGILTYTCTRVGCGHSYSVATYSEHEYVLAVTEATCTVNGEMVYTCTKCGDVSRTVIPASHSYVSSVTKKATQHENGVITYTCVKCGHSYTENIPATESNVLLIQDSLPWGKNVIPTLLSAMKANGTIEGFLTATTADVEDYDLKAFDMIFIANDQRTETYNSLEEIDDLLVDYAKNGGTLIYGACDRGSADGVISHNILGGVELIPNFATHNYIVDPLHPIVTGALTDDKAITNDILVGRYCSNTSFDIDTVPTGYRVIFQDANGDATLVEYPLGNGRVILSGLAWELYYDEIYEGITSFSMNGFDDLIAYAMQSVDDVPHTYDAGTVVPPTCTSEGYTIHTCTDCGATIKDCFVAALGHDAGAWVVDTAPTCTEAGQKHQTCSRCYETVVYSIPASGHNYSAWTNDNATNHKRLCANCGDLELSNHIWNMDSVITAPTHFAEGVATYSCSVCGANKTASVPKTDVHEYGEWISHNESQHKRYCKCGSVQYEAHAWDGITVIRPSTPSQDGLTVYTCSVCKPAKEVVTPSTGGVPVGSALISAETVKAKAGEEISIPIVLKNSNKFCYLSLEIGYSADVFSFVSISNGDVISSMTVSENTNPMRLIWSASEDVQKDSTLAVLKLKVKDGVTAGNYTVSFTVHECYDANEGDVSVSTAPCNVEIVDFILGDVNGDGVVNGKDSTRLLRYLANYDSVTGTSTVVIYPGADVTGDGLVNGKDVTRLLRYLANLDYTTGESTVVLG